MLAGDVTAPGDLWWIMRPQPPLGTVEIRVFDLPTDWRRTTVFAAVCQAALAYYQDRFEQQYPPAAFQREFLEGNRWKAMRYGLDTDVIEPETGAVIDLPEHLRNFFSVITDKADELNCAEQLAMAEDILETGNEAAMQRKIFADAKENLQTLELKLADMTISTS